MNEKQRSGESSRRVRDGHHVSDRVYGHQGRRPIRPEDIKPPPPGEGIQPKNPVKKPA